MQNLNKTLNDTRNRVDKRDKLNAERKENSATASISNTLNQSTAMAKKNIDQLNEMEKTAEKMEHSAQSMHEKAKVLKNRAKNHQFS